jgi:hypothetical protein
MEQEVADAVRLLPERAPALPAHVREALVRGLAIRPNERFADAAEMADALNGVEVPLPSAASAVPAAAASTSPRPAARPSLGAVSVEPEPDEGTRVMKHPARRRTGTPVRERTVPPPIAPRLAQPQSAFAAAAIPRQQMQASPRPGAARRFFRALWDFVVTMVVMALFVGSWALAGSGVLEGERDRMYAGAAATVLFTPMAIHRLTGRRGRYSLALFGSIVATAAAVYYVGQGEDVNEDIVLLAMFGLQVVASFVMTRFARRKAEPALEAGY